MGNRTKTLLAVVLLVALVGVVAFQFYRMSGASKKGAPAEKAATTAPAKPSPAPETKAPSEGAPAAEVSKTKEGTTESQETAQEEGVELTFIDKKIEGRYRRSRFFSRNAIGAMPDPFIPPATRVPVKPVGEVTGGAQPTFAPGGSQPLEGAAPAGPPEMSLLPLPSEILSEETHFTLIGLSSGRGGSTGLFRMGIAAGGEVPGGEEGVVMAHEGWLIGNDYVFLGLKGNKAQLLNRKDNSIILLSTGETV